MKTLPPLDELKKFLTYDPETGFFTWIKISSNNTSVGHRAGSKETSGYWIITFKAEIYKAHRIAWLFVHGAQPFGQIDHINGKRDDNRISNLREVTNRENQQNNWRHRAGKNVGVSFKKDKNKWKAYTHVLGKQKHLGYFETESEAFMARKKFLSENPQP